jgi:gluconokinase
VTSVVVMGVTGAGKTTIGRLLADALDLPFLDADDFHDAAAIAKMRAGVPLDDADRAPWLDRLNRALREHPGGAVLAASALTDASRRRLANGVPEVRYVFLRGDATLISERLAARVGHFAGAGLLPSQIELLDPPAEAVVVDVTEAPDVVAARALAALGLSPPRGRGTQ